MAALQGWRLNRLKMRAARFDLDDSFKLWCSTQEERKEYARTNRLFVPGGGLEKERDERCADGIG